LLNLFVLPALFLSYGANREEDLGLLTQPMVEAPASAD